MSHLIERLAEAVRTLVGDGTVKERLARAYLEHLEQVDEVDLPAAARPAFAELRAALTRVAPCGNQSAVRASVQKMSAEGAARHARAIVALYAEVAAPPAAEQRAEPLKVIPGSAKAHQPPRYLTGRS